MSTEKPHITIFEHDSLKIGHNPGNKCKFEPEYLEELQEFYGVKGVPYYSLIHRGVKFCEYVGVLQLKGVTIEVLPKADSNNSKSEWQKMLIAMLKSVGSFNISAPSSSYLSLNPNSILHLYFELFVNELEYLFHKGLIKTYRKTENNRNVLKGSLYFPQQIQKNFIHQERFYVKHTTYDRENPFNQVLYKTIKLLSKINDNAGITSRIGALLLNFPELKDIQVSDSFFDSLHYNRKTEDYRNAIQIARLLLLNYHPDLLRGKHDILALMFDMNLLWERFVYMSLNNRKREGYSIKPKHSAYFWKPEDGRSTTLIPDILIAKGENNIAVIDTKWKNPKKFRPSADDLQQMYAYHKYFKVDKAALVYPGDLDKPLQGNFFIAQSKEMSMQKCSIISINSDKNIKDWQKAIADKIFYWIEMKEKQEVTINK